MTEKKRELAGHDTMTAQLQAIHDGKASRQQLIEALDDPAPQVRAAALEHLDARDIPADKLEECLTFPYPFLRRAAVQHGLLSPQQLERALQDADFFVRAAAVTVSTRSDVSGKVAKILNDVGHQYAARYQTGDACAMAAANAIANGTMAQRWSQHLSAGGGLEIVSQDIDATIAHLHTMKAEILAQAREAGLGQATPAAGQRRKFYKTVLNVEVLSEDQSVADMDLATVALEIVGGGCSGKVSTSFVQELSPQEAAKALKDQGSDPAFFGLTQDGGNLEDEDGDADGQAPGLDR